MTRVALTIALAALAAASLPLAAQEYPRTPPPPGPVTPAAFPPIQEATLPNGLRILVVENRRQPTVSLNLAFPAGGIHDPAGKEGLAEMVAGLLTKGAGTRTAEEIAATIEGVGGSLGAGAGADFLSVNAGILTPNLPLAFELLADVVMRPRFPEQEVSLLRTQTLSGLQVELSQPGPIASRAFARALYGDHPYGRSTTPASVRAITRDDLVAFHGARLRPGGALLVLAGDINLAEARRLATEAFRGWSGRPPAPPAAGSFPAGSATEIVLVHRPGSVQSNILVGNLTYPPDDPRLYANAVGNRVLGGGADSRLFLILREQKSWTYGAYSSFARRRAMGFFNASAEVRTEVTDSALREMLVQLERIRTEPVLADELDAAKGALVGSFPLSIETAEQVAGAVANARLYGLPDDYIQTYRVKLAAVTPEEIREAARTTIRPDAAVIVVVGDGTRIHDALRAIAPVRIVDPEGKPLTPADLSARAAPLAVDATRLTARSDSFTIMLQGNPLGFLSARLEKTPDGFRYLEHTRIAAFVEQRTEITLDAAFRQQKVSQTGTVQGQQTSIEVTFAGGRATGSARTPTPEGIQAVEIDTTVAAGVLDDNLLQPVMPTLAWAPGARWTFPVFSSASGETREVTLSVTGTESVTTPAGTVESFRAELTGGPQPVTFWVSVAAPHVIQKIAIAGTPVEMVRAVP